MQKIRKTTVKLYTIYRYIYVHVLQYSLHRLTKTRNRGCTNCSGVRGDMLGGLRRLKDEMKREERGERGDVMR